MRAWHSPTRCRCCYAEYPLALCQLVCTDAVGPEIRQLASVLLRQYVPRPLSCHCSPTPAHSHARTHPPTHPPKHHTPDAAVATVLQRLSPSRTKMTPCALLSRQLSGYCVCRACHPCHLSLTHVGIDVHSLAGSSLPRPPTVSTCITVVCSLVGSSLSSPAHRERVHHRRGFFRVIVLINTYRARARACPGQVHPGALGRER
jgi:hypothetical protein